MAARKRPSGNCITVVTVEDPLDPFYPFGQDLYADDRVVYHGTWSTYCSSIEEQGMAKDCLAYNQADVDSLCEIGWRFGFFGEAMNGGLGVLMACAYGVGKGKRSIYLSRNYWCARGYARNRGGETIHHAAGAIAGLERFLADPELRKSHARELRRRLHELEEEEECEAVREQLASLDRPRLLEVARRQVARIATRLRPLADGGYPVVYAVRADARWYHRQNDQHRVGTLEVTRVPPQRIRARAEFLNGVHGLDEDALMPRPLRWALGPYLEFVKRMADGNFLHDHVRYLQQATDPVIRAAYEKVFR